MQNLFSKLFVSLVVLFGFSHRPSYKSSVSSRCFPYMDTLNLYIKPVHFYLLFNSIYLSETYNSSIWLMGFQEYVTGLYKYSMYLYKNF